MISRGRVLAVARRDLASILRNRGIVLPLVLAPTLILVVLPILLVGGGSVLFSSQAAEVGQGAATQLGNQIGVEQGFTGTGFTGAAAWPAFVLLVFVAPLYLLVPLMVATVIAADSFAGELDRGTLEALLNTPTTDRELFVGKFLSAWGPAVVVSWGGFVVYAVLANVLGWPTIGQVFFPTLTWAVLAVLISPALAALALGVMVLVSSRVNSVQAAHQFGSLVVLPVIVLLVAQVSGALTFDLPFVLAMAAGLWLAALLALRLAANVFDRNRLAERL